MSFLGLNVNGVAIGMAFFIFARGVAIVDEYTVLYLEQLGYSNTWIGLVPMLGLFAQIVGLPLLSYFADKYRARKLFLFLSVAIAVPSMLVFLAAPIPQPICEGIKGKTLENINTTVLLWNTTDRYNNGSSVVKLSAYAVALVSNTFESLSGHAKIHESEKPDSRQIVFFVIFFYSSRNF